MLLNLLSRVDHLNNFIINLIKYFSSGKIAIIRCKVILRFDHHECILTLEVAALENLKCTPVCCAVFEGPLFYI